MCLKKLSPICVLTRAAVGHAFSPFSICYQVCFQPLQTFNLSYGSATLIAHCYRRLNRSPLHLFSKKSLSMAPPPEEELLWRYHFKRCWEKTGRKQEDFGTELASVRVVTEDLKTQIAISGDHQRARLEQQDLALTQSHADTQRLEGLLQSWKAAHDSALKEREMQKRHNDRRIEGLESRLASLEISLQKFMTDGFITHSAQNTVNHTIEQSMPVLSCPHIDTRWPHQNL